VLLFSFIVPGNFQSSLVCLGIRLGHKKGYNFLIYFLLQILMEEILMLVIHFFTFMEEKQFFSSDNWYFLSILNKAFIIQYIMLTNHVIFFEIIDL